MIKSISIFLLSLLIVSCAQQGILTGGEKDIDAPMVDTTKLESPKNGSVNFTSNRIEIPFNEFVSLHDIKKQIIITPFLSIQPSIYVKGKKVVIDFKSPLEPNTTYIINFGDAIKDITEGNVLKNYKYVFSTGSFLDSLKYQAFVFDAYSKKPVADALVMLYRELNDSVVKKQKPIYFAKTNSNGSCTIENIANQEYKVFVLLDKNNNYLFDQLDEPIGFKPQSITFTEDSSLQFKDTLAIFINLPSKKTVVSSFIKNGKVTLALNTPIANILSTKTIFEPFKAIALEHSFSVNKTRDTLTFWLIPEQIKTQDIEVELEDYGKTKLKVLPNTEKKSLQFTTNAFNNLKPKENLTLKFDEPIIHFDTSKIKLVHNSKTIAYSIKKITLQEFEIVANWKEDESYEFEAFPKAFSSAYETVNDTLHFYFDQLNAQRFGSIELKLEGEGFEQKGTYIVQLLQNNKVIYQTQFTKESFKPIIVDNLVPNKYTFCIIFDSNNNGIWDTGDYFNKILPERIEYYNEIIDVRKGWDSEVIWKIDNNKQK